MAKNKGGKNKGGNGPKNHGGGQGKNQSASDAYPVGKGALGKTPKAFKGYSQKKIQNMAKKTTTAAYKPALHDIKTEKKETKAIAAKRAEDNQYYNEWLANQTAQLTAHAEAADAEIASQQQQAQAAAATQMQQLRDQLTAEGGGHAGVVSDAKTATAFDVSPEALRNVGAMVNERALTAAMSRTNKSKADTAAASNSAMVMAMEANRQGELWKRLGELSDDKKGIQLERAGAQAAEVARLLTQEIDKAKAKVDMKNMAANASIAQQAQNLEQKKYRFDVRSTNRQLVEDKRQAIEDEQQAKKNEKHDVAQDKAENKIEKQQIKLDEEMAQAETAQEKKQASQEVTGNIENGIIAAKGQKGKSKGQIQNYLQNHGMDPLLAQAAAELSANGKLSPATIKKLESTGYQVPSNYK